jgi:hypothetical protein
MRRWSIERGRRGREDEDRVMSAWAGHTWKLGGGDGADIQLIRAALLQHIDEGYHTVNESLKSYVYTVY